MYKVIYIFLIFFIYSIIGYLCEVMGIFFETGKLNFSRGYFIGPYLPIFGFGSLIITYYLNRYQNDLVALFIMGSFFCCLLEYLTSLIMKKIFKLRWWDYSHKKFNLNGRICLETGVLFGIGSLIIVKITNPIIFKMLSSFNHNLLIIIYLNILIINEIISLNKRLNLTSIQRKREIISYAVNCTNNNLDNRASQIIIT